MCFLLAFFLLLSLWFCLNLFLCFLPPRILSVFGLSLAVSPPLLVVSSLYAHGFLWICFDWSLSPLFRSSFAQVRPPSFLPPLSPAPFLFPPLPCWGLSLAFIKPEKVLCPGLQKWRASWRREIVASGMASWASWLWSAESSPGHDLLNFTVKPASSARNEGDNEQCFQNGVVVSLGICFSLWSLNSLNLTIGILISNNWFLIVPLG